MCGTTDALTNAWHDVSKPFVDTSLGRMATNVATGGMSAPAFAAYDISNGADPLKAAAGGVMGYFGGSAGNDWLSGAGAPAEAGLDMGGQAGMGTEMGDYAPGTGGAAAPSTGLGSLWGPEDAAPTPWSGGAPTAPTTMDNYMPLENTPGASMDTTGLNKTGDGAGWLSRMGSSATKAMGDAWSPEGIGKSLGNMGPAGVLSGLAGMYTSNKTANAQQDRFNQVQQQINGTYAPGSPEYEALMQQLSRTDAAAGRNSQLGPRSVDLAAKIAQLKMNAMSGTLGNQNTMFNSSLGNRNQGLSGMFGVYGRANPQQ